MSDVLLDLPSHLRDRLVSALESGLLGPSPTLASLRSVLGDREDAEDLAASLLEIGGGGWTRTNDLRIMSSATPVTDKEEKGLNSADSGKVLQNPQPPRNKTEHEKPSPRRKR